MTPDVIEAPVTFFAAETNTLSVWRQAMSISTNYAIPVTVNGFSCKNCTEVEQAKKHIDPAHPNDGPYGINAPDKSSKGHGPGILFGGRLAGLSHDTRAGPHGFTPADARLDIFV